MTYRSQELVLQAIKQPKQSANNDIHVCDQAVLVIWFEFYIWLLIHIIDYF